MPGSAQNKHWNSVIFLLVFLISAAYMGANLKRAWVPHDEGILAEAAERVLHGEIPHRDFNDPYTGGLAYLDAFAFRILGVNLLTLRYVLFFFFLLWVPTVFAIAREFCGPWAAATITIAAVVWSVPNYTAAMPSWFCLFFATFGSFAILKYVRNPRVELLIAAGLCGGFSVLMKTPGVFYVAGVLLFLAYLEQSLSRKSPLPAEPHYAYFTFFIFCLVVFVAMVAKLILTTGGVAEFFHFVFPSLAIAIFLVNREGEPSGSSSASRFKTLLSLVGPFILGVIIPLSVFFSIYWRNNSVHQLFLGLFVLHLHRLLEATLPAPNIILSLPTVLTVLLVFQISRMRGALRLLLETLTISLAVFLLLNSRSSSAADRIIFESMRNIIPVMTITAMIILCVRQKAPSKSEILDDQIMLLICVTALWSLVQFPFPSPIYFSYVAPLAMLGLAALLTTLSPPPRRILYSAAAISIIFALIAFHKPDKQISTLTTPRAGGLRVLSSSADQYNRLIPYVSELADGRPILAGPDAPEIYFLTGLPNPTPIFFDFFHDANEYRSIMQSVLDRDGSIHVVVLKSNPEFSRYHRDILRSLVVSRFSQSRKFESFEVFWRP
jgi:hypothetical protein